MTDRISDAEWRANLDNMVAGSARLTDLVNTVGWGPKGGPTHPELYRATQLANHGSVYTPRNTTRNDLKLTIA